MSVMSQFFKMDYKKKIWVYQLGKQTTLDASIQGIGYMVVRGPRE